MKSIGYFILLYISALTGCSCGYGSCVNRDVYFHKNTNAKTGGAGCTVSYSGSKTQSIELPNNCQHATIINSGSGILLVSSTHVIDVLTVINSGSNSADLSAIRARKIVVHDRGSGILHLNALEEVSGFSQGSGTIIMTGSGKNSLMNRGSGIIVTPQS